jgi:predicted Zn-dependent protease
LNVKTKTQVNAKEEDTSPDFSAEPSQVHTDYRGLAAAPDPQALEKMVRRYSGWLSKYPYVYRSWVMVTAEEARRHFVSTEGTRLVTPSATVRLVIEAETQADDGMELMRVETFQAETAEQLPNDTEIAARVDKMSADLKILRAAPLAEPYSGPALLSGRAVAVFFHEVLG